MRGHDAYAVLGLRPGAGRAEIDQAYRRLIKRYHPDFAGGDANRAAELNRAYSELRAGSRAGPRPAPQPAVMRREIYARPPSRWRAPLFAAAAVVVAALLAQSAGMTDTSSPWPRFSASDLAGAGDSRAVRPSLQNVALDEPLANELIESSVRDAMRLHDSKDPVLAAEFSRDCLSRLSANPSVPLFDSCTAYDEAIAILSVGDPVFESGAFNPLAVTARQVGAARLLSADDFEAESRLQQIRSRVHMALLPQIADGGRAAAQRVATRVRAPRRAAVPTIVHAPVGVRPEPRRTVSRSGGETRLPQLAPRRTPEARTAPAAPPPAAESRPGPAWQRPIKPAWQRPLPPGSR